MDEKLTEAELKEIDVVYHGYEDGYKQLAAAIVMQAVVDVETPRRGMQEALRWLNGRWAYELAFWGCGVGETDFAMLLRRLSLLVVERARFEDGRFCDTLDLCAAMASVASPATFHAVRAREMRGDRDE